MVGTYTSPELITIRETICINNEWITADALDTYLKRIKKCCERMVKDGLNHPTRFEVLTALAFLYFNDQNCSIVVLETGMGGRLDATNVHPSPICCVITAIAMDHMQFLGDTIEAIAYEKSGIIKPCSPVVLYPAAPSVYNVFKEVCRQNEASLTIPDFDAIFPLSSSLSGQTFSYKKFSNLHITLLGKHQLYNAVLALETVEVLKRKGFLIANEAIYKGFAKAKWHGRFEQVYDNPLLFIDGAHNVQGALSLSDTLKTYCTGRKIYYIMGLLKDKDYVSICQHTTSLADAVFVVKPSSPRALEPHVLADEVRKYCTDVTVCPSVEEGVHLALHAASPSDIIIAFGSLYFIGQIPDILKRL